MTRILLKSAALATLAGCLEFALRACVPMPYAPNVTDVALLVGLYGLTALPAVVATTATTPPVWLERGLLALPFALMAADLGFAFGVTHGTVLVAVPGAWILGVAIAREACPRAAVVASVVLLCLMATSRVSSITHATEMLGPNVLLVVLDTTGAEHLSLYGYQRPTSPRLQTLATRSLLYRRAIAAAPWTVPSHGAIFTGRFPSQLGFDGLAFTKPGTVGSIAADLRATGRVSVGISANGMIPADSTLRRGFSRAWDEQRLSWSLPRKLIEHLRHWSRAQSHGERITDLALDWVDRLAPRAKPWFLFVNYLDPHVPYCPPEREREEFAPGIDPDSIADTTQAYNSGRQEFTPEVRRSMNALYDGEVAAVDRALGRLLDTLAARGFNDSNLLVIVTADHGEALGEHGVAGHIFGVPETVLHVPLLISGPGVQPGEVKDPVQTVQIRATIRTLLGLPALDDIAPPLPPWGPPPGLLITEHPWPQWYFSQGNDWPPTFDVEKWRGDWVAVERDGLKVVFDDRGHGATYELRTDPGENAPRPLADGQALVADYRAWRAQASTEAPHEVSEHTRRALESMGYVR